MNTKIHHIAAISSDLHRTSDFYCNIMGLKVFHKNPFIEGPKVCHFYWNEEVENFLTFYHCPGLAVGKTGINTIHTVSFSVAFSSFHYWLGRLRGWGIQFSQMKEPLYSVPAFLFKDPDGLQLKLVFSIKDNRNGLENNLIPASFSVKGFYGIEISSFSSDSLAMLLSTQFQLDAYQQEPDWQRFSANKVPGSFVDVFSCGAKEQGFAGSGMVHHMALQMHDWEMYMRVVEFIKETQNGSIFRQQSNEYSSLYFREKEGILFEVLGRKKRPNKDNPVRPFFITSHTVKKKENSKFFAFSSQPAFQSMKAPLLFG